ncbi:MAG: sodium-dependent transporter [Candidatus Loosdrechtia sp.]|uniref:sodium-dependent transporter n=1 Tax=Candidatus Loosdrechtia sp. TaxID=3101272 RepID=UPI003A63E51B|nr:MAG: sodium-dependent transporter [Candidatus Jettenia sp. AMX2]
MLEREHWGTRLGLILAVAGNAVGLGNFLRFPVQAAKHGGGAFMISYFVSFLLLGIPLMWVEWSMGRYGGARGHGASPGVFHLLWKARISKYLGIIGIVCPLTIVVYYLYITSWTVGYSLFSLSQRLPHVENMKDLEGTLKPFTLFHSQYIGTGEFFLVPSFLAYAVFVFTLLASVLTLARGISKGIELLAKIAMPLLFLFAVLLVIRVFTLDNPLHPDNNPLKGLAFLWEPDFSKLLDLNVWLAAAGQMFFTLSLGMGAILTYASYLRENDDIALSGLTTASTNEFAEVVLGGSIAIPAAVVFFGVTHVERIANEGAFHLAFVSMPAVFSFIPLGYIFGFLWFGLLFFAGITSVVALSQPAIAFLEDEFQIERKHAAWGVGGFLFVSSHIPVFIKGTLDELDFWSGTFFITLFATMEIILFFWIFGSRNAWEEMNRGAEIRIPRIFFYVCKYITPNILIIIFAGWMIQYGGYELITTSPDKWIARGYLIVSFLIAGFLVHFAWKKRETTP